MQCLVGDVALTRSGDKGAHANVGVWTHSPRLYRVLVEQLTAERVRAHFAQFARGPVERFELPNLRALNFILRDALDGGGSKSLRTDAQGKVFGTGLALMTLDIPDDIAALLPSPITSVDGREAP
ncbi:MAG TPA: hypothetical protein VG435_07345 [Acidimicrobiales bacterium]|jgi:hypothetical protein|nr:hypothetical protein [Acidimicrobiales bacterium]